MENSSIMSLEDFYKKWEQIKIPKDLPWFEKQDFLKNKRDELLKQLTPSDRKEVESRDRSWASKQQSSVD